MKKVSVIIPTYNRAAMLDDAVSSVLAQTYQNFEILISDDGSTDNTQEVVKKFDERVNYLYSNHSGIPAIVRNKAIIEASGEYIAFLDSDDLWLPDKLELQVEVFENDSTIGLVCSNAFIIDNFSGQTHNYYLEQGQGQSGYIFIELLKNNFIVTSTVVVRRASLDQAGYFSADLRGCEDYNLWLRIAHKWRILYVEKPLACYRNLPDVSIRSEQRVSEYFLGMISNLDGLETLHLDGEDKQQVSHQKDEYRRQVIIQLWKEREYRKWILACFNLLRVKPSFSIKWWYAVLRGMMGRSKRLFKKSYDEK